MQKYTKYVKMISDPAQRTLFEYNLYITRDESRLLEILAENNIQVVD